ncbi:hypothetical protein C8R48DRAFT_705462 [Suillus tomentosus]|nr:hypothetical protein C8R48DRAFT_705462 [Suillus tomentosus]
MRLNPDKRDYYRLITHPIALSTPRKRGNTGVSCTTKRTGSSCSTTHGRITRRVRGHT